MGTPGNNDKSKKPTIFFLIYIEEKRKGKLSPGSDKKHASRALPLEDKTRVVLGGTLGVLWGFWRVLSGFFQWKRVFGQKASRRNSLSPRALASAARRKLLSASFDYFFVFFFLFFLFSSSRICIRHGFCHAWFFDYFYTLSFSLFLYLLLFKYQAINIYNY